MNYYVYYRHKDGRFTIQRTSRFYKVAVWNSKMQFMVFMYARLYSRLKAKIRAKNENINPWAKCGLKFKICLFIVLLKYKLLSSEESRFLRSSSYQTDSILIISMLWVNTHPLNVLHHVSYNNCRYSVSNITAEYRL